MKKESYIKLAIVTAFAIAMGFLEASVVVYLRKLFYPLGFSFPLKGFIEPSILGIEWIREFATIVMLLAVGFLAGKKLYEKFAYFIYAFAIWDIFYYIFLKLALNWPLKITDWDMLFLIPWPWAGPVLAPLLLAALMIVSAFLIIDFIDKGKNVRINLNEWALIIIGVLIALYTFLYDYGVIIFKGGFAKDFFTLTSNQEFIQAVSNYNPIYFNWVIFLIGLIISSLGILIFYIRMKKLR